MTQRPFTCSVVALMLLMAAIRSPAAPEVASKSPVTRETRSVNPQAARAGGGATTGTPQGVPRQEVSESDRERLREAIDDMAEVLDEFGTISISTPLLTRADERLKFGLARSADSFYDFALAKVQGEAAALEQTLFSFGASASEGRDESVARKHEADLLAYEREREHRARVRRLLEAAAEDDFRAAMHAATVVDDPAERGRMVAEAKRKHAEALAAIDRSEPEYPVPARVDAPDTPSTAPPAVGEVFVNQGKFQDPSSLLKTARDARSPALSLSSRQALNIAAGDMTSQGIFNVLGDPEKKLLGNRTVLFGVSMVSVQPGWRTQTGWAARVSALVDLSAQPARPTVFDAFLRQKTIPAWIRMRSCLDAGIDEARCKERVDASAACAPASCSPACSERRATGHGQESARPPRLELTCEQLRARRDHGMRLIDGVPPWLDVEAPACGIQQAHVLPAVSAVSPMSDVQTLDLASSERHRRQISLGLAFSLAAAGRTQEANAFLQFVKQREKDVATRTAAVPVVSFSAGHTFGYEIGGALHAIGDVPAKKAVSATVLQRQSFPALLLLAFEDADLRPRLRLEPCDRHEACPACAKTPGVEPARDCTVGWRLTLVEPLLQFTQFPRWVPTRAQRRHRVDMDDLLEIERDSEQALADAGFRPGDHTDAFTGLQESVLRRQVMNTFSTQSFSTDLLVEAVQGLGLPESPTTPAPTPPPAVVLPQVDDVVPREIDRAAGQQVVLVGKNLGTCTTQFDKSPSKTSDHLLVALDASALPDVFAVELECPAGMQPEAKLKVWSPPIRVRKAAQEGASAKPVVTYEVSGAQGTERHAVRFEGDAAYRHVGVELVQAGLERAKADIVVVPGACPGSVVRP